MANLFDRIGDITRSYVLPAAQFAGDVSTEYMLRAERAKYNQLNGSGAPDDDAFLAKTHVNVDGATANGLNKFSATNQIYMALGGLAIIGAILWLILRRR